MSEIVEQGKLVELTYEVRDAKSDHVISTVDFPLNYVHGYNDVLAPQVLQELEGKTIGDIIEVPIDCNTIFGPRDENLVITDRIENVPEEYREIGTTISMENEKGEVKNFLVTRIDDKTLTVDGNNPMCGREVIFKLEILNVREASEEEVAAGGKDRDAAELDKIIPKGAKAKTIH